jgi:hypothetical protein
MTTRGTIQAEIASAEAAMDDPRSSPSVIEIALQQRAGALARLARFDAEERCVALTLLRALARKPGMTTRGGRGRRFVLKDDLGEDDDDG